VKIRTWGSEAEFLSHQRPAGIIGGDTPGNVSILQLFFQKIHIFKNSLAQISEKRAF